MTYKTLEIINDLLTKAIEDQKTVCEDCNAKFIMTNQAKDYQKWRERLEAKSRADEKREVLLEALRDFENHEWP